MVAPVFGGVLGAGLGALGGVLGARTAKRARRRQRRAIGAAQQFAKETVERITSSDLFRSAREFITSTFRDAETSPLAEDFAKRIRAAQSVRGTFTGNLAAAQEAVGTSGFAQRLRQSLLPAAQQFSFAPEQLRLQILQTEAPLRVAAATGAGLPGLGRPNIGSELGAAIGQGISGFGGGFQLGRQLQFSDMLANLRGTQIQRQPEFLGGQVAAGVPVGRAGVAGIFDNEELRRRIQAAGRVT